MKKVFICVAMMAIMFSACEKEQAVLTPKEAAFRQEIIDDANVLSHQHDSLVRSILTACKEKVRTPVQSISGSIGNFTNFQDVFDAIESVTGIKPQLIKTADSSKQFMLPGVDSQLPVFDFDQGVISLTDYANSGTLQTYFTAIDIILQDTVTNTSEKIFRLSEIQQEAWADFNLTHADLENFMNSTTVLKGSLLLWNDYAALDSSKQQVPGVMKAKPMTEWSFWAKLAFVAAADAVGAVAGTFIGSYIMINGIPVYIPAGPQGACAGLAILSVLAAKMVGW